MPGVLGDLFYSNKLTLDAWASTVNPIPKRCSFAGATPLSSPTSLRSSIYSTERLPCPHSPPGPRLLRVLPIEYG